MFIIDRIEDGIAVIEDENSCIEVPVSMLERNVREGDAVTLENGIYVPDKSATEKRRQEMLKMQDDIWDE